MSGKQNQNMEKILKRYNAFCKSRLNESHFNSITKLIPFFNVLVIKQELEYEQNYTVKIQILIYIFIEILLHQLNGSVK